MFDWIFFRECNKHTKTTAFILPKLPHRLLENGACQLAYLVPQAEAITKLVVMQDSLTKLSLGLVAFPLEVQAASAILFAPLCEGSSCHSSQAGGCVPQHATTLTLKLNSAGGNFCVHQPSLVSRAVSNINRMKGTHHTGILWTVLS